MNRPENAGEPLLYLVHRLPYPPNKGDKIRSYHILRHLTRRHRVYLGTFVDTEEDQEHVATLRETCADVCAVRLHPKSARLRSLAGLLRGEALTAPYYRNAQLARWVDATLRAQSIRKAVLFSSPMAQYVAARNLHIVADYCDADSAKWSDYATQHRWPMSWIYRREGRRLLAFEREHALRSQACVFATEAEKSLFARLAPDCAPRLHAMENGVDQNYWSARDDRSSPYAPGEETLVFTGAMDYWPNVDAVTWFAREVLPRLHDTHPRLRFTIVGMNPDPAVQALAADPAITVTGKVADVRPYVQHARAVVAPLRIARGIQNKIIEAMAMGRPVVVLESAAAGLRAEAGRDYLRAPEDPAAFAEAIRSALRDGAGEALGRHARAAVTAAYDWDRNLAALDTLLEDSAALCCR